MFGFSNIQNLIKSELSNGGSFAKLISPLPSTNLNFVQFKKKHELHGAVYGLGVSRHLKTAQIISYFEFLERLAFLNKDSLYDLRTSNGLAAHKFLALAKRSALNEIVERDSFLMHWYLSCPFLNSHISTLPNDLLAEATGDLAKQVETHLFTTNLGYATTTVCILENRETGGFCVGTSAGKGRRADAEKSFVEAVINLKFGDYGFERARLISEAKSSNWTTLNAHRAYWLYCSILPKWVKDSNSEQKLNLKAIKMPDIEYLPLEFEPFPVVVARSNQFLTLEVGLPSLSTSTLLTKRIGTATHKRSLMQHPLF